MHPAVGSTQRSRARSTRCSASHVCAAQLSSQDAVVRATACDLARSICERFDGPREAAASRLLEVIGAEDDSEVLASAARALGATSSDRAIPALVALADHPSEDVRFQVARRCP